MPRPFLRPTEQEKKKFFESQSTQEHAHVMTPAAIDASLRKTRSTQYVNQFSKLDIGGKTWNLEQMNQALQIFDFEFSELPNESKPLGIVAACDFGDPYEVHTLDIQMETIVHHKKGQKLPAQMENARGLALHPSYAFVEVYTDHLRVIEKNGEVSVIKDV
jgi:hypothetical protein